MATSSEQACECLSPPPLKDADDDPNRLVLWLHRFGGGDEVDDADGAGLGVGSTLAMDDFCHPVVEDVVRVDDRERLAFWGGVVVPRGRC